MQITLKCRPDLLQQWQVDIEKNPGVFAHLFAMEPKYLVMLVHDAAAAARLNNLVNNPHTEDFLQATRLEAAHQVLRFGEAHDRGKSAENWFWLVGYLAGKCLRAAITGDRDKALHHTISSAAALMNWHAAIALDDSGTGAGDDMDLKAIAAVVHRRPIQWERRRAHVDGRGSLTWQDDWKACSEAEAKRVAGLRTWEVRFLTGINAAAAA